MKHLQHRLFWGSKLSVVLGAGLLLCAGGAGYSLPNSTANSLDTHENNQQKQVASQDTAIPFFYDPIRLPYIVVNLDINGITNLPFIVDTGSVQALILTEDTRKKLALEPMKGGESGKFYEVLIQQLPDTNIKWKTQPEQKRLIKARTYVTKLPDLPDFNGKPIAGIIGMPLLGESGISVNFDRKILTQRKKPLRINASSGGSQVKIPIHQDSVGRWLVDISIDSETNISAFIDTGCYHSVFDSDLTGTPDTAEVTSFPVNITRVGRGAISDVLYILPKQVFKTVETQSKTTMGNEFHDDLYVVLASDTPSVLGLSWLSRYNFDIDISNKQLILSKPQLGSDQNKINARRQVIGTSGLRITPIRKDSSTLWQIATIYSNEPGAKTPLKVGDRIITVDGVALPQHPYLAQRLLDGFAGTTSILDIATSSGKRVKIPITRVADKLGVVADFADIGMQLGRRKEDNAVLIMSVEPQGYADNSGLKSEDELILLNGKQVSDLSWRGIHAEIQKVKTQEVEISYRRNSKVNTIVLEALRE